MGTLPTLTFCFVFLFLVRRPVNSQTAEEFERRVIDFYIIKTERVRRVGTANQTRFRRRVVVVYIM